MGVDYSADVFFGIETDKNIEELTTVPERFCEGYDEDERWFEIGGICLQMFYDPYGCYPIGFGYCCCHSYGGISEYESPTEETLEKVRKLLKELGIKDEPKMYLWSYASR